MSSVPASRSPGSQEDPQLIDQRKRKRMLSNRDSARRSRMKKQQRLDELINEAAQLNDSNNQITMQIDLRTHQYDNMDSENNVLRAQLMELTNRLKSTNSILQLVEDFCGMEVDIPEIPDPLLNPWQFPCPVLPIRASADMLQC